MVIDQKTGHVWPERLVLLRLPAMWKNTVAIEKEEEKEVEKFS